MVSVNLKELLTNMLTLAKKNRVVVDSVTKTISSVAASSYVDVSVERPTAGTFLSATMRLAGTQYAVPIVNAVSTTAVTVRIKNVSSNALSNLTLTVYIATRLS